MIKRIFCLVLSLSMLLLTGCRLAKPEKEPESRDRLAGVLVTREHLDLFDVEAFAKDHASDMIKGGSVDTSGYQGRIYGELTQVGNYEDGAAKYELTFPDLEGYFLVDLALSGDGTWTPGGETYSCYTNNGGFYDVKYASDYLDDGEMTRLEMTLAFCEKGSLTMYANPIYQTRDGRVYVTTGSGLSADLSLGGTMTQNMNETVTVTADGKSESRTTDITVHAQYQPPTRELQLIQMDESSNILVRDIFEGAFPEKLTLEEAAAYLIVQTSDGETVERKICTPSDTVAGYFTAQGELCIPNGVELLWKKD